MVDQVLITVKYRPNVDTRLRREDFFRSVTILSPKLVRLRRAVDQ